MLLRRILSGILRRPRRVLGGTLVLALLAALLGTQVEFRTSRNELAPAADPDQRRWEALLAEYKGSEAVIACVEAVEGSRDLKRFADELARSFAEEPAVERVFHRIDLAWFRERALHLIPPEIETVVARVLEEEGALIASVLASPGLPELNRALASRIEAGFGSGTSPPPEAESGLGLLSDLLRAERRLLAEPAAVAERWLARPALEVLAGAMGETGDGYLATHDRKTLLLLVVPHDTDDSLPVRRELLGRLELRAAERTAATPGFRVVFTGPAAMAIEEMDSVRRDTWLTSVVAALGVSLLTLLVFRWRSHAPLVLAALAVGLIWSFGAVALELGYLNMITSAFVSTLVGVGVAYGIHPVSEYELAGAHTADPLEAIRLAYHRTGPAVATAGLTTAVAFLSILLMRFRGFAELGLVAGVGVLLCLAASMICLPAMLAIYGSWRHTRDRTARNGGLALDRIWLDRAVGRICAAPKLVALVATAATLVLGWSASRIEFDTNILDLLPRDAESLRYQRRVTLESDLSPFFNIAVADDLGQLRAMQRRFEREPSIERFESALRFLPSEADGRDAGEWTRRLAPFAMPERAHTFTRDDLVRSLDDLETQLSRAGDAAFTAGLGSLAGPLEQAREEAERAVEVARSADASSDAAWHEAQGRLLDWLREARDGLRRAAATEPPRPETLPPEIRGRFFTASGKPLAFLYPKDSVFDPEALDAYVEASLRVDPEAIGFPFMFRKMSNRITAGFYRAVLVGGLLVLVVLVIDLRSARDALLALVPLVLGLVWTLGIMNLTGLSLNFANLVGVPLIIGVGIDNGVHVLHRIRHEGREGMGVVLRHTGRAILIASLTTMVGFGSLGLAAHRGLASLGVMLLIGVGACLLTSTVVLPNLLVLFAQVRR